jgi:hypothetical protein
VAKATLILLALPARDPDPEGPPVPRSCPDAPSLPEEFFRSLGSHVDFIAVIPGLNN